MSTSADPILTVAQMRAAEQALIDAGESVSSLMERAGVGAADWVWRIAGGRPVTVLCGPGNNGGDGYVVARELKRRGAKVSVVAPLEPATEAAIEARRSYGEATAQRGRGGVLVDCLFGSGLTRLLSPELHAFLTYEAAHHATLVAVDMPSGIDSDSGQPLNAGLPACDVTLALGAWKFAHWLMPAMATMGERRLVPIGVGAPDEAARLLARPRLTAPAADAHKYTRGLLAVVGGAMPGAAVLAGLAAQGAGAGYVKLMAEGAPRVPADMVLDTAPLAEALADKRIAALLVGPGLGRDPVAWDRLATAMKADVPVVADADALWLFAEMGFGGLPRPAIATPHEGEFEHFFGDEGNKIDRTRLAAQRGGTVVVHKGPDTVIAAPDGRVVCAPTASAWLSTAGTGDVLAGIIASRLATGVEAFEAACEGVWLHGEAARLAGPAFTASELARHVGKAYAAAL